MPVLTTPNLSNTFFVLDSFVTAQSPETGKNIPASTEYFDTATSPHTTNSPLSAQTTEGIQLGADPDLRSSPPLPSPVSVEAAMVLDQKLREIEQSLKDDAQWLTMKASRYRESFGDDRLDDRDEDRDDALVGLEPAPIPPSWHLEGDPSPRVKIMTCSPEGGLLSGIWTCKAAKFRFDYANFDETVHIIRGIAEVRIGDETTYLRPGSIAYFPKGATSEWTVHEPIHKYFVQRNPNRGVRKIRAWLQRFSGTERGGLA